jgi:hypothetical protein
LQTLLFSTRRQSIIGEIVSFVFLTSCRCSMIIRFAASSPLAKRPASRACSAFMMLYQTLFFSGCVFGHDRYQNAAPWPFDVCSLSRPYANPVYGLESKYSWA